MSNVDLIIYTLNEMFPDAKAELNSIIMPLNY